MAWQLSLHLQKCLRLHRKHLLVFFLFHFQMPEQQEFQKRSQLTRPKQRHLQMSLSYFFHTYYSFLRSPLMVFIDLTALYPCTTADIKPVNKVRGFETTLLKL